MSFNKKKIFQKKSTWLIHEFHHSLSPTRAREHTAAVPVSATTFSSELRPQPICWRQREGCPQGLLVLGVLCFMLWFAPGHSILCGVRHAVCKRTQRRGTGWGEGPTKYHSLSGLQSREPPLFLCISNVPGDLHLIRGSLVQLCPIQDTEERDGSSPWHSPERAEL